MSAPFTENIREVLLVQDKVAGEFENLAQPHRRYIKEGALYAEMEGFSKRQYFFFLFNDMMVACKKNTGSMFTINSSTANKLYKYLTSISLTANAKIIPGNK